MHALHACPADDIGCCALFVSVSSHISTRFAELEIRLIVLDQQVAMKTYCNGHEGEALSFLGDPLT